MGTLLKSEELCTAVQFRDKLWAHFARSAVYKGFVMGSFSCMCSAQDLSSAINCELACLAGREKWGFYC